MLPPKKIRVLVVDDSMLFRKVLSRGLSTDSGIEVVATANDAFDAYNKVIKYKPDVLTCDIELPQVNGIELIRSLMKKHPLPVIVVTTFSGTVFDSLKAGAVDFVTKPDVKSVAEVEKFIYEMIKNVKIASLANVKRPNMGVGSYKIADNHDFPSDRVIAIAASTGGTEATYNILKCLPANIPGILIVQHIPPEFSRLYAERLNDTTEFTVKEAESGDYVQRGSVLVAPGDHHMVIKKEGERYKVKCYQGSKINGHRPSADVLFESVAKEAGGKAIGVILTGMGYDGAKGLLSMRKKGARTIGQDEGSCVVYGMPKAAYDIGAVEKQASLQHIPKLIYSFLDEE